MPDARTDDTREWIEFMLSEGGDPDLVGGYDRDLQRFLRRREGERAGERNRSATETREGTPDNE